MKSTGIVRRIDHLGRIVIPKELRRKYAFSDRDGVEIYVDEDKIVLKKYEPSCVFCSNADNIITFRGKNVCADCARELAQKRLETDY